MFEPGIVLEPVALTQLLVALSAHHLDVELLLHLVGEGACLRPDFVALVAPRVGTPHVRLGFVPRVVKSQTGSFEQMPAHDRRRLFSVTLAADILVFVAHRSALPQIAETVLKDRQCRDGGRFRAQYPRAHAYGSEARASGRVLLI